MSFETQFSGGQGGDILLSDTQQADEHPSSGVHGAFETIQCWVDLNLQRSSLRKIGPCITHGSAVVSTFDGVQRSSALRMDLRTRRLRESLRNRVTRPCQATPGWEENPDRYRTDRASYVDPPRSPYESAMLSQQDHSLPLVMFGGGATTAQTLVHGALKTGSSTGRTIQRC